MKKILSLIMICLLSFSMFLMLGSQVMAQEEYQGFQASYSTGPTPLIDGIVTDQEWNDANSHPISLSGDASTVQATVYFKHNGTMIYLGLKVFADDHDFDEFTVFFDEGNDGLYGSGTGDGVLTSYQEDLKECFSPPISGNTIEDGSYKNGTWYGFFGGDFNAACVFVNGHWESEFSIPFVGNDVEGADDVSDLVCSITDTVGIKIQYFTQPGANNYFYPAGDQYDIGTYTTLSFSETIPPGDNVTVYPDPEDPRVSLTFEHIITSGTVTATKTPEPPEGVLPLPGIIGLYYDFEVTFTFTGTVQVSIPYDDTNLPKPENELTLWHYNGPVVGDVNADGKVDLRDIAIIALALGTRPGSRRWNPAYDLNIDGRIDLRDLLITLRNLGETSWVNVTTAIDTVNNVIFGETPNFPPFGVR